MRHINIYIEQQLVEATKKDNQNLLNSEDVLVIRGKIKLQNSILLGSSVHLQLNGGKIDTNSFYIENER